MNSKTLLAAAFWLTAGAAWAGPDLSSVLLKDVPFVRQQPDFCGEACVAMDLQRRGLADARQEHVFDASGLDPAKARGLYTRELKTALLALGYFPGRVWHKIDAQRPGRDLDRLFAEVHEGLLQGHPSILCTRFDQEPDTTEHFRLIIGYDADEDEVIYHDPALDDGAFLRMSRTRLYDLWPLKYDKRRWTVVKLALRGSPTLSPRLSQTPARVAQHIMALQERLPRGFAVRYIEPFVVVSNAPAKMRDRALHTVRWTTDQLRQHYFDRDPVGIHDVYLFGDDKSYRHYATEWFGEDPGTPYGYYSASDKALVMNIATGRGTLVHEMVHPFMAANIEDAPAWLNEGLGSLYEAAASRDGKIVGTLNWRLAGLKNSIRNDELPRFDTLVAMGDNRFYSDRDGGDNYAQSRYLLYYIQQQGRLAQFWSAYRKHRAEDPTGRRALEEVLQTDDLAAFQPRWERWVLRLSR